MGCGASSDDEDSAKDKRETVVVGPDAESSHPEVQGADDITPTKAGPVVKMNKAQELRLAKMNKEKEEEEKRKNGVPHIQVSSSPPPTVKLSKAQEQVLAQKQQQQAPPVSPAATPAKKSPATSTPGALLPNGKTAPSQQTTTKLKPAALATLAVTGRPTSSGTAATSTSGDLGGTLGGFSSSFGREEPPLTFTEADFVGFTTHKMLGKGSFGSTFECALRSCQIVCVKIIEFGDIESNAAELLELRQEIELMKRFNHPNIVQYYGCTEDKEKKQINIFMEYVTGGSLNSYMKKFETVPVETARRWTKQMLAGVKYLHDAGIVHRDLKGANLLVTNGGVIKVADFGCSKSIDETCSKTRGCKTMVGTPYWMAPEVLKSEPYGTKADIWSIGCTVIEMLTGKPAWPEMENMWAAVYKIANSTGLPPGIPKNLPKSTMKFLERCFERSPAKRASAAELLVTPWMQEEA